MENIQELLFERIKALTKASCKRDLRLRRW